LLRPLIDDEVDQWYEQIKIGSVILFPEKFFRPATYRMQSVQQEVLDFSMDRESFKEGIIRGLKVGSRAKKAGLKDGVRILSSLPMWKYIDHINAEIELVVKQAGLEKSVKY
jgi:hypothetical protein